MDHRVKSFFRWLGLTNELFIIFVLALCLFVPGNIYARLPQGPWSGHLEFRQIAPPISSEHREDIKSMLTANRLQLEKSGVLKMQDSVSLVELQWPLKVSDNFKDPGYHGVSGFVDHNASYPDQLKDYSCGVRTYDLDSGYNHQGTDYFLWPFPWHKVDANEVTVVATAPGVVIGRFDGNPDRNCDFGEGSWNAVYIQHADGNTVLYGHLKQNSVTSKQVGDSVSVGEYLGVVASSGNSTGPHLHMEVVDPQGNIIDPYSASCQPDSSLWVAQRPYYDSAVNALRTHFSAPEFRSCPEPTVKNERNQFKPGERIYLAAYYRDQLAGQQSEYTLFEPDGSIYSQWTHASSTPHYAASYWYWYFDFPPNVAQGVWNFQVIYEGVTYSHYFTIRNAQSITPPLMLLLDEATTRRQ